jgi:Fe-S-cluster containining protein
MTSIEAQKAEAIRSEGRQAAEHFALNGVSKQSILSLVQDYWGVFDNLGEVYLPAAGGKVKAACAKGCSMCCHTIIFLTAPEALILAEYIERTQTKEEFTQTVAHVRATNALTHGKSGAERWGFGPPCPLLDQDSGCCSVYAARPLACRGAYSSSLQSCTKAFAERATNPRALGMEPFIFQNADILIYALAIGLKAAGRDLHKLELNAALTAIWSQSDAFDLWLGRADIFNEARAPGLSSPLV